MVLPTRPLPLRAEELEDFVREELDRCQMSIHLIGRNYGIVPEDGDLVDHGTAERVRGPPRRRPATFPGCSGCPPSSTSDDLRQQIFIDHVRSDGRILNGADLLETSFEELRTVLRGRLEKMRQPAPPPSAPAAPSRPLPPPPSAAGPAMASRGSTSCAISAIRKPSARGRTSCSTRASRSSRRSSRVTRASSASTTKRASATCDGVLIFYGAGNELWLRRKLREVQKIAGYGRSRPMRAVGICVAPPMSPAKAQFRTHEAMILSQPDGFAPDPLRPFVDRMKAAEELAERLMAADGRLQPLSRPAALRGGRRPPLLRPRAADRRAAAAPPGHALPRGRRHLGQRQVVAGPLRPDPVSAQRVHGAGGLQLARRGVQARRGSHRPPGDRARRPRRARATRASWATRVACSLEATLRRSSQRPRRGGAAGLAAAGRERPPDRRSVRGAVPVQPQSPASATRPTSRWRSSSCCCRRRSRPAVPIYVVADDALGLHRRLHGRIRVSPRRSTTGQYLVPAHDARRAAVGHHGPGRRRRRRDRAAAGHAAAERRRRRSGSAAGAPARADAHVGALGPGRPSPVSRSTSRTTRRSGR